MEYNHNRKRSRKEKNIAFVHVSILFILSTAVICVFCLYFYTSGTSNMAQKENIMAKKNSMQSFRNVQRKEKVKLDSIYRNIRNFDVSVNAVYEENDIRYSVESIRKIYKQNEGDRRYYIFSIVASFYDMWFDDQKILWTKKQNVFILNENLQNCKAGLQEKIDLLNASKGK